MNYILFDDSTTRSNLMPLTFIRPIADILIGITTIREKWEKALGVSISSLTETYLQEKFPLIKENNNILINSSVLPTAELVAAIKKLKPNQALSSEDSILAYRMNEEGIDKINEESHDDMIELEFTGKYLKLNNLWDIYNVNDAAIRQDYAIITEGRKSGKLSKTNTLIGEDIFVEEGAKIECAMLNASTGPIYIGKDVEIMEGTIIRGPFAACDHSVTKLGSKIYGATTIGPYSKVGGEVSNVVMMAYSNKVHDGFLGNSVIGEWCNIGAGTTSSNLKNSYDEVKLWNYTWESFQPTGQQFCGLIMGDHSKVAINTTFNTGTVVGVAANIFGAGFQRNFIPSFTWGGSQYDVNKAITIAKAMYARRNKEFTKVDEKLMKNIFKITGKNRLK